MKASHVFYKEITVDEENISSANLLKNNEVERIRFEKSKLYALSRLSINQKINAVPNVEGKKGLSNI